MAIEWHLIYFAIGLPAEILNLANILGQYSGPIFWANILVWPI